jgi:CO/xanthine dehydrogenase Mo-binding subunit
MAFVKYKNISGYAGDRYRADRSTHEKAWSAGEPSFGHCVAAISNASFDAISVPLRSMPLLPESNSPC